MTQPLPRLFFASLLAIILTAIAAIFSFSQRTSSANSSIPQISKEDRLSAAQLLFSGMAKAPKPAEVDSQHELAVPFYDVSGDWTSTLMLSNQAPRQMQAAITLFSLTGQQLQVPAVTLKRTRPKSMTLLNGPRRRRLRRVVCKLATSDLSEWSPVQSRLFAPAKA